MLLADDILTSTNTLEKLLACGYAVVEDSHLLVKENDELLSSLRESCSFSLVAAALHGTARLPAYPIAPPISFAIRMDKVF